MAVYNFLRSLLLCSACFQWVSSAYDLDPSSYSSQDVIYRDVAIIGGGSSGVYTGVRLQDYKKSVVIVEKEPQLGGHAQTYIDPMNGFPINLGVVVFANSSIVRNYFARFSVPLTKLTDYGPSPEYVDFATGQKTKFIPPSSADVGAAFKAYATQLEKYPALQTGFNLTYPVAPDLLLPFGTFVEKYNLSALLPITFEVNQGYSPLLKIKTLYMLKYLNAGQLESTANGFLTTLHDNTGELYTKAAAHFGPDALLSSSVLAMSRSDSASSSSDPVKVLVSTPQGKKLIVAKKLLSTPPPMPSVLQNYDLTSEELHLFNQFFANGYYTGVLNNTGLQDGVSYVASAPRPKVLDIPAPPTIYTLAPAGGNTNLTQVFYGSAGILADDKVQANILCKCIASNESCVKDLAQRSKIIWDKSADDRFLADVSRLREAQGLNNGKTSPATNFVAFSSHAPFNLMVSDAAIRGGFYEQLYGLQGKTNTFWNGAAWMAQDSSAIWQFTEQYVLPSMLAAL